MTVFVKLVEGDLMNIVQLIGHMSLWKNDLYSIFI